MMETVLDVGLNFETVEGLIRLTGNPRLAWDSFRRLVQGFAEVVAGLPVAPFDLWCASVLTGPARRMSASWITARLRDLTPRRCDATGIWRRTVSLRSAHATGACGGGGVSVLGRAESAEVSIAQGIRTMSGPR